MPGVPLPHQESAKRNLVENLYRQHRGWLVAWLLRGQGCPQRAEDLSQDTFLRLLRRSDLLVPREPRALLTSIAKGLLIDHFRRCALERAYQAQLEQLPEALQPSEEERLLLFETLNRIDTLLGRLSSKARAAFLHSRLDGLGHAEIAARLGVSVPRVRQYLAQATRQCYIALYGEPT
ncbi:RNA polymerase sigma factor [Stutzerimonas kirkiae]|uniref:RNA polymerase sigma factor n=1 Tax=Stutzerimonas kirkiae TaxID=2211392 RepID=UPI003B839FE1